MNTSDGQLKLLNSNTYIDDFYTYININSNNKDK